MRTVGDQGVGRNRMRHILYLSCLALLVVGCHLSSRDFLDESSAAFHGYVTGDVQTATQAIIYEESIIRRFQDAGIRGIDYHHAYLVAYGRLCALYSHSGQTDEAERYFQLAMLHRAMKGSPPMQNPSLPALLNSIESLDRQFSPRWRTNN